MRVCMSDVFNWPQLVCLTNHVVYIFSLYIWSSVKIKIMKISAETSHSMCTCLIPNLTEVFRISETTLNILSCVPVSGSCFIWGEQQTLSLCTHLNDSLKKRMCTADGRDGGVVWSHIDHRRWVSGETCLQGRCAAWPVKAPSSGHTVLLRWLY